MNITELRYLVAIMETGSVSAAAKELYVAQPNVSKALKNLEEEYGLQIFERTSTGMLPTEQGRGFIAQAERILEEIDRLEQGTHTAHEHCVELRAAIPHTAYAYYAAADFMERTSGAKQLRVHILECGLIDALNSIQRRGYHMALVRYAAEDADYYRQYCAQRGLRCETIMEFDYGLLTSSTGPLAGLEINDLGELKGYTEVLHDDSQLPDGNLSVAHLQSAPDRRVHIHELCSQFTVLQRLPKAYMWAAPLPQRVLEQYGLTLCKCPAQRQRMCDVLVCSEKNHARPEERLFRELLLKQAQETVR